MKDRISAVFTGLPGAELVEAGLADLRSGRRTEQSLLLLIASPRLRRLGLEIPELPDTPRPFEHSLYSLLEAQYGRGAYSRYNSLIRRIVSFSRSWEREVAAKRRKSV